MSGPGLGLAIKAVIEIVLWIDRRWKALLARAGL